MRCDLIVICLLHAGAPSWELDALVPFVQVLGADYSSRTLYTCTLLEQLFNPTARHSYIEREFESSLVFGWHVPVFLMDFELCVGVGVRLLLACKSSASRVRVA